MALNENLNDLIKTYAESYLLAKKRGSQFSMDNQNKHIKDLATEYPKFEQEITSAYNNYIQEVKTDTQKVA
jgi:hypothetical protein